MNTKSPFLTTIAMMICIRLNGFPCEKDFNVSASDFDVEYQTTEAVFVPPHHKTNNVVVRLAKTQISLGTHSV